MNEEELFCKLFPEYVVNGKPLSPYFDLFESGYEQAENRIAELKEANKTLATMNNNMWVELEKKRAESQGITNKLHQLIEAKELLKRYVPYRQITDSKAYKDLAEETEQFLNSEVEK